MKHTIQNDFLTVTAAEAGAELQSILGADSTYQNHWTIQINLS